MTQTGTSAQSQPKVVGTKESAETKALQQVTPPKQKPTVYIDREPYCARADMGYPCNCRICRGG